MISIAIFTKTKSIENTQNFDYLAKNGNFFSVNDEKWSCKTKVGGAILVVATVCSSTTTNCIAKKR